MQKKQNTIRKRWKYREEKIKEMKKAQKNIGKITTGKKKTSDYEIIEENRVEDNLVENKMCNGVTQKEKMLMTYEKEIIIIKYVKEVEILQDRDLEI